MCSSSTDYDCDGSSYNGCTASTCYDDADNDNHGWAPSGSTEFVSCAAAGRVSSSDDCDDSNDEVYPGHAEWCNGVDNNCNGMGDEPYITCYKDADGDGYSDGTTETGVCSCSAGYDRSFDLIATSGDCNDGSNIVYPGAPESGPLFSNYNGARCSGTDYNCDGTVHGDTTVTCYPDVDTDGYGFESGSQDLCTEAANEFAGNICNDGGAGSDWISEHFPPLMCCPGNLPRGYCDVASYVTCSGAQSFDCDDSDVILNWECCTDPGEGDYVFKKIGYHGPYGSVASDDFAFDLSSGLYYENTGIGGCTSTPNGCAVDLGFVFDVSEELTPQLYGGVVPADAVDNSVFCSANDCDGYGCSCLSSK